MPPKNKAARHAAPAKLESIAPRESRAHLLSGALLIAGATLFVYSPALNGRFLWDDGLLITDNPFVRSPSGLYNIWFTREPVDYWPVTNTVFWLEWRLWGTDTTGYHVVNLALHIANALLIWIILRKLSIPGAFLAALLFAVHPVNVESVAWIAQLKNVLSLFFFLLSILAYLRFDPPADSSDRLTRPTAGRWYWLSLLAFLLAMLSKGSVAIIPLVLLLLVWWQHGRITHRDLLRTVPFFVVAVVLVMVNIWFQTHGSGEIIRNITPTQRFLGAGAVIWFYLYKAIWPLNLAIVYPQWDIHPETLLWWLPLSAAVTLTAILIWKRKLLGIRHILVAWTFFCVALLPVMGLTDVYFMKYSLVSDHYQYIAIIIVLALVAAVLASRSTGWPTVARFLLPAMVTIACCMLTWRQSRIYDSPDDLYDALIEKNPNCWLVYNNRGFALYNEGQVEDAIVNYEKALQLEPNLPESENNLGVAFAKLGHYHDAIPHYQKALQLKSNYAEAHGNLGIALLNSSAPEDAEDHLRTALKLKPSLPKLHLQMADFFTQVGNIPQAIDEYQRVLRLRPDLVEAHNNLAALLSKTGRSQLRLPHYVEALRIDPRNSETHYNLANALGALGQPQAAVEQYLLALQIDPEYAAAHYNLANIYLKTNRLTDAIEHYQEALQLKPDYAEAHSNLGGALAQSGQMQPAIEHYHEAIRLKPDYPEAYANLAAALAETNRIDEAIAAAEQAIALARAQKKSNLAEQLEAWLTDVRAKR